MLNERGPTASGNTNNAMFDDAAPSHQISIWFDPIKGCVYARAHWLLGARRNARRSRITTHSRSAWLTGVQSL